MPKRKSILNIDVRPLKKQKLLNETKPIPELPLEVWSHIIENFEDQFDDRLFPNAATQIGLNMLSKVSKQFNGIVARVRERKGLKLLLFDDLISFARQKKYSNCVLELKIAYLTFKAKEERRLAKFRFPASVLRKLVEHINYEKNTITQWFNNKQWGIRVGLDVFALVSKQMHQFVQEHRARTGLRPLGYTNMVQFCALPENIVLRFELQERIQRAKFPTQNNARRGVFRTSYKDELKYELLWQRGVTDQTLTSHKIMKYLIEIGQLDHWCNEINGARQRKGILPLPPEIWMLIIEHYKDDYADTPWYGAIVLGLDMLSRVSRWMHELIVRYRDKKGFKPHPLRDLSVIAENKGYSECEWSIDKEIRSRTAEYERKLQEYQFPREVLQQIICHSNWDEGRYQLCPSWGIRLALDMFSFVSKEMNQFVKQHRARTGLKPLGYKRLNGVHLRAYNDLLQEFRKRRAR